MSLCLGGKKAVSCLSVVINLTIFVTGVPQVEMQMPGPWERCEGFVLTVHCGMWDPLQHHAPIIIFFTNEKLENNILIEQFESEATHRHMQDIGKGHLARPGWSDGASIRYQVLPCCTETKT